MGLTLSILDLSPVSEGASSAAALRSTLDLARRADDLGYHRYWLAEHHNSGFIASAVPEIMIAHVAGITRNMRVGSGGVMLPNHAPLKVAEAFRTLEALHPGRIDLGLGRAPGTDPKTAIALRRSREALRAEDFPEQLTELLGFLSGDFPVGHPYRSIVANPAGVDPPDLWLLGSSGTSARIAAERGLAFAFAHHISPLPAVESLREYRATFRPSAYCAKPKTLIAVSAICAPADDEAEMLAKPVELALLRLGQGRRPPLTSIEDALAYPYRDHELEQVALNRGRLFVGTAAKVRGQLLDLAEATGVDEIMVTTITHDPADRIRSYELLAAEFGIGSKPE